MGRALQLTLFLVVASAIVFGWHWLLWARLVRDAQLPAPWRAAATWALVGFGGGMVAAMALSRVVPRDVLKPFAFVAFAWMGVGFLMFFVVVAGDLGSFLLRVGDAVASSGAPADPSRRALFARGVGALALALGLGGGAVGIANALGEVAVKHVRVPLRRLPTSLSGFRIVQITDIHVGPTIGRDFVARIVARVVALAPDLVAITGDLVDGSVASLSAEVAPLAALSAPHGVFFVTGNHEYYSGAVDWVAHLATLGVRVLRNEHVSIGEGDASFDLAGVDDWTARGLAPGHGHDLGRALAGRDPSREVVLLAHQPRSADQAAAAGVGLQLSGHTHGGQLVPWNWFVKLQTPFVAGLYRVRDTFVYVSRGTGYWGPPMRLGAPAEITVIELVREG